MRRTTGLVLVLCLSLGAVGCSRLGKRPAPTPPAEPLTPKAPYVAAAEQFFASLNGGDTAAAWGLLTKHFQGLLPQAQFAKDMAGVKVQSATPLAEAASGDAAYVLMSLQATVAEGRPKIAGYTMLLLNQGGTWHIALLLEESRLPGKVDNLSLRPSGQNYVVSFTDEKGHISTNTLRIPSGMEGRAASGTGTLPASGPRCLLSAGLTVPPDGFALW